jgi:xanthine dehydrogenase iron-sulfur cluster and FAD-binding subunit A
VPIRTDAKAYFIIPKLIKDNNTIISDQPGIKIVHGNTNPPIMLPDQINEKIG